MNTIVSLWIALLVLYLFSCFAVSEMTKFTSLLIKVDRDEQSLEKWIQFFFKVKRWQEIVIVSHNLVVILLIINLVIIYLS